MILMSVRLSRELAAVNDQDDRVHESHGRRRDERRDRARQPQPGPHAGQQLGVAGAHQAQQPGHDQHAQAEGKPSDTRREAGRTAHDGMVDQAADDQRQGQDVADPKLDDIRERRHAGDGQRDADGEPSHRHSTHFSDTFLELCGCLRGPEHKSGPPCSSRGNRPPSLADRSIA